jgi:hypothetical protein
MCMAALSACDDAVAGHLGELTGVIGSVQGCLKGAFGANLPRGGGEQRGGGVGGDGGRDLHGAVGRRQHRQAWAMGTDG